MYINWLLLVAPSGPQSLEIVSINSSSVTLQWRPPENPNGVVTHYSIQLDKNITIISISVLMYTIEGLSPDTVYVLQVRAHTGAGAGPPSNRTVLTSKLCNGKMVHNLPNMAWRKPKNNWRLRVCYISGWLYAFPHCNHIIIVVNTRLSPCDVTLASYWHLLHCIWYSSRPSLQ